MSEEPHHIILDHLRHLRDGQGRIEKSLDDVRTSIETLHAHDYAQHADMGEVRRRLDELEAQVERLNTAQGVNQGADH